MHCHFGPQDRHCLYHCVPSYRFYGLLHCPCQLSRAFKVLRRRDAFLLSINLVLRTFPKQCSSFGFELTVSVGLVVKGVHQSCSLELFASNPTNNCICQTRRPLPPSRNLVKQAMSVALMDRTLKTPCLDASSQRLPPWARDIQLAFSQLLRTPAFNARGNIKADAFPCQDKLTNFGLLFYHLPQSCWPDPTCHQFENIHHLYRLSESADQV